MARPACRVGDVTTGHQCYPPAPASQGASTVFINGSPAFRKYDKLSKHTCMKATHENGIVKDGSTLVIMEGKGVSRVGDICTCPENMMTGSSNVHAG